jgi:hypothetical protein
MGKNYINFGTEQNRHRRLQLFTCGVNSEQQFLRALSRSDCRGRLGSRQTNVERSVVFCENYCKGENMQIW